MGGGGIGPPLMDDRWIYGSAPENIYASIVQGRPNGMPAWGGRSCVFIGEEGMLLGNGKLLPEERFKDFKKPAARLPRRPSYGTHFHPHSGLLMAWGVRVSFILVFRKP